MDEYKPIREKIREEVDSILSGVQHLKGQERMDALEKLLEFEDLDKFSFVQKCFYESLRKEPPVNFTPFQAFNRDVTLGYKTPEQLTIKAGQSFVIVIEAIHNDPKLWIEPERYIPERFDHSSPYFKAPDGKPRHPFAFQPFLGGHRVCLGKTFAETSVKYTIPLILHFFDMELSNKAQRKTKEDYNIVMQGIPEILFDVKRR